MGNPKPTFVHKKHITIIIIVATIYGKVTSSQALCYWFYIKYSYTSILPVSHRPPIHIYYLHTHIPPAYAYTTHRHTLPVSHTPPIHICQAQTYITSLHASIMVLFCRWVQVKLRKAEWPLTVKVSTNGILLSHEEERNNAIWSNMDGPRDEESQRKTNIIW